MERDVPSYLALDKDNYSINKVTEKRRELYLNLVKKAELENKVELYKTV